MKGSRKVFARQNISFSSAFSSLYTFLKSYFLLSFFCVHLQSKVYKYYALYRILYSYLFYGEESSPVKNSERDRENSEAKRKKLSTFCKLFLSLLFDAVLGHLVWAKCFAFDFSSGSSAVLLNQYRQSFYNTLNLSTSNSSDLTCSRAIKPSVIWQQPLSLLKTEVCNTTVGQSPTVDFLEINLRHLGYSSKEALTYCDISYALNIYNSTIFFIREIPANTKNNSLQSLSAYKRRTIDSSLKYNNSSNDNDYIRIHNIEIDSIDVFWTLSYITNTLFIGIKRAIDGHIYPILRPFSSFLRSTLLERNRKILDPNTTSMYIYQQFQIVLENPMGVKVNRPLSEFLIYGIIKSTLQGYEILLEYMSLVFGVIDDNPEDETTELEGSTLSKQAARKSYKRLLSLKIVFQGVTWFSPFGLSTYFAMVYDVLHFFTIHIKMIHYAVSNIYSLEMSMLSSLFTLFLGYKYNILNRRVDHIGQVNSQQLLFSTLCFTITVFLLPTIIIFYIISCSIYLIVPLISVCLYLCYMTICDFPLFQLIVTAQEKLFLYRKNKEAVYDICLKFKPISSVNRWLSTLSFFSPPKGKPNKRYFYIIAPAYFHVEERQRRTFHDAESDGRKLPTEQRNICQSPFLLAETLPSSSFALMFWYSFLYCNVLFPLFQYCSSYINQHLWSLLFGRYSKFNWKESPEESLQDKSSDGKYPRFSSVFCEGLLKVAYVNIQKGYEVN